MTLTLAQAAAALPKVELHVHIEGTMRPGTVVDLARRNGIALPTADVTELYEYDSLDDFLSVFWLVQSTLAGREDWARLAYESVLDGAAHGRVYAETFFTPARHLEAGASLAEIIAGLAEGLSAADAETGARTMLICDADRAYGGPTALALVEELKHLRENKSLGIERVIGFGMDSTEIGVDPLDFAPAFHRAAEIGLRRTAHQGEDTPASVIATVIDALGAERVDHGLTVLEDPALVHRMAEDRIPLTVCPTSNVVIANRIATLTEHPLPRMREAGLLATINTDDPAMSDLNLAKEYALCAAAFDWTWDELVQVALDGVEASWLDESDQRTLRARITTEAQALGGQI